MWKMIWSILRVKLRDVDCSFQGICGSKNLRTLRKLRERGFLWDCRVPAGIQGRPSPDSGLLCWGTETASSSTLSFLTVSVFVSYDSDLKKNYKLCGFKPQKFILLWFWVPEVQNESYRAKIKVSAGLLPSGGPKRKFISCLFQLWGGCQHSLACGCITPISFYLIILSSPFLWSNSPLPPFLRSLVITYRKQIILPFQDA